jgi:hypothetical protein
VNISQLKLRSEKFNNNNNNNNYYYYYTVATGSFTGVKRPGRGVDHPPPPSSAEVKEIVELYLYQAFVACSTVNFTFIIIIIIIIIILDLYF